jgi:hypothetical protein
MAEVASKSQDMAEMEKKIHARFANVPDVDPKSREGEVIMSKIAKIISYTTDGPGTTLLKIEDRIEHADMSQSEIKQLLSYLFTRGCISRIS